MLLGAGHPDLGLQLRPTGLHPDPETGILDAHGDVCGSGKTSKPLGSGFQPWVPLVLCVTWTTTALSLSVTTCGMVTPVPAPHVRGGVQGECDDEGGSCGAGCWPAQAQGWDWPLGLWAAFPVGFGWRRAGRVALAGPPEPGPVLAKAPGARSPRPSRSFHGWAISSKVATLRAPGVLACLAGRLGLLLPCFLVQRGRGWPQAAQEGPPEAGLGLALVTSQSPCHAGGPAAL